MKQRLQKNGWILLLTMIFLLCGSGMALAEDVYTVTVNQNAQIDLQITDSGGRTVAPGQAIDTISYIIKSKPEDAKVSATTANDSELENTGKLTMAFCCDKPGTVEVQTFIRVKNSAKYYTGIHTIQVIDAKKADSKIVILSIGSRQMIVNDDVVQFDVAPEIQHDRTYVPLRALSDIFAAQCSYDSATQQITITKDDLVVVMTVGAEVYTLNGVEQALDAPAYLVNGRTMVPVRFIAEAFGSVVKPTYDESGAVADIMFQF
jgi:hypothetical protein